ncbi:hypothetical protein CFOL_v3_24110, partial [Cephalotus follicularis]
TSNNIIIETIHPPSEKLHINIPNGKIQATQFKLQAKNIKTPPTIYKPNKIIEQNNYTNRHLQTLDSQLSRIESMIQKTDDEIKTKNQKTKPLFTPHTIPQTQIKQLQKQTLGEINQRLQEHIIPDTPTTSTSTTPQKEPTNKIQINAIQENETSSYDSIQNINNQLSAIIKTEPLTSYYYRPTYPDLQIEGGKFTQACYQSITIYE